MIWASAMANVAPMQTRGPPPKWQKCVIGRGALAPDSAVASKAAWHLHNQGYLRIDRLIGLYFYEIVNPSALSNEFVMLPEGAAAPRATQLASRTLSSSGGSYRFAWNSM